MRDATQLASTIASILIKGQAFGTPARGDRFEIAAEQILAATIGKVKLPFHPGPDYFLSSSNTYDFSLREITA